jgi:hypothetical protein
MGAAEELLLKMVSGRGLLDARALWASLVGPYRLAMAQTCAVTLSQAAPTEIYKSMGSADGYVFVGVSLPADTAAISIPTLFSKSSEIGNNSSIPVSLSPAMIGGTFFPVGFSQLLMPAEQLYAQLTPAAPAPTQRVVVASVVF